MLPARQIHRRAMGPPRRQASVAILESSPVLLAVSENFRDWADSIAGSEAAARADPRPGAGPARERCAIRANPAPESRWGWPCHPRVVSNDRRRRPIGSREDLIRLPICI